MSLVILSELQLHEWVADARYGELQQILEGTRDFNGCRYADVLVDRTDPTSVVLSVAWDSEADYAAYRVWRASADGASNLAELLAGPSTVRQLVLVD